MYAYTFVEIQGFVDKEVYWFVAINVPDTWKLGRGALKWKSGISAVRTSRRTNNEPGRAMVASQPSVVPVAAAVPQQQASVSSLPGAPVPQQEPKFRPRILAEQPSDSDRCDLEATEDLAASTENTFSAKICFLKDPMASKSAEFKVRMCAAHIHAKKRLADQTEGQDFVGTLHPHMKVYL